MIRAGFDSIVIEWSDPGSLVDLASMALVLTSVDVNELCAARSANDAVANLWGRSLAEIGAEHGMAALRLRTRSLVLEHIPVLDKHAVDDANNVRSNPVLRPTVA